MTRCNEVDPGLAGIGHSGLGRLTGQECVEAQCGRLAQAGRPAARQDPDGLDCVGTEVPDEGLPAEGLATAAEKVLEGERLRRPADEADVAAAMPAKGLGTLQ